MRASTVHRSNVVSETLEGVECALEEFVSGQVITEVLQIIKSGKEATAYLCRAHPSLGCRYAVAKLYHETERRNFANDALYQEGRLILNARTARAVAKKSSLGSAAAAAMWVDHEFEVLSALHYAGADVPEPFAANERAIVMSFAGVDAAAPQLQHARVAPADAGRLFERLLWDVELFLANNVVHGDLSAFNVLYDGQRPVIIDFPQSVDPRFSRHAAALLERDLANLGRSFRRWGIEFDAKRHAQSLWQRWRHGEL